MEKVEKALGQLAGVFAIAGALALTVLAIVTGVSVFYRYVLRAPIFGIEDVTTMSLTVVVAASIAWAAVHRGHVSVNIITMAFGRSVTRVTDVLARLVSCAMMAFAGYALFSKGACGFECGAMTSNLGIIHTPFYYTLACAMCLYAGLLAMQLLIGLAHWRGVDPNEITD